MEVKYKTVAIGKSYKKNINVFKVINAHCKKLVLSKKKGKK